MLFAFVQQKQCFLVGYGRLPTPTRNIDRLIQIVLHLFLTNQQHILHIRIHVLIVFVSSHTQAILDNQSLTLKL